MARTHGKNVDIAYAGVALEDEASNVTLDFSVPASDITSLADTYQNRVAGKPAATLSIDGFLDPAGSQGDATIFGDLGGAAQTWDFEPDGTTGYNGYAIITSYRITAPVDGAITYNVSMNHNGTAAAADAAAPTRA